MSAKKKFSKTGLILVACMIVCLLLALAVVPGGFGSDKKKDLDDENTPGIKTVLEDGSPLMIFDKRDEVKTLIADFDDDKVQSVSAELTVDRDSVSIDISDQKEITAVYKALKNVVIGEKLKGDESHSADCSVVFVLADGSVCGFAFENESVYMVGGEHYAAAGTESLWSVIEGLANE